MNERVGALRGEDLLTSLRWLVSDGSDTSSSVTTTLAPVAKVAVGEAPQAVAALNLPDDSFDFASQPQCLLLTPALRVDPPARAELTDRVADRLAQRLAEREAELVAKGRAAELGDAKARGVGAELLAPLLRGVEGARAAIPPLRLVSPVPSPDPEEAPSEMPVEVVQLAAPVVAPEPAASVAPEITEFSNRLAELEGLLAAVPANPYEAEDFSMDDMAAWVAQSSVDSAPFIQLKLSNPLEAQPEVAAIPAPPQPVSQAEPPLDAEEEGVLRDIIRSVLREELEGPMGERVTRNLRKLIRTEISRAFAARGLT